MSAAAFDFAPTTPPRCPKCGRFVAQSDIFPVLDVLTYEAEGIDLLRDCFDCPRDGRVEVSWW